MNKEVIKANKDVFNYWLNGGRVWIKSPMYLGWNLVEPSFISDETIYVQDDQYAELRKAQADGKVIESQVYNSEEHGISYGNGNNWRGNCLEFIAPVEMYRIKPDKPKFKVGDWIIDKINGKIIQLTEHYYEGGIELWKPKEGEWCVFNDSLQDGFYIEKFKGYNLDCEIYPLEFIQTLK